MNIKKQFEEQIEKEKEEIELKAKELIKSKEDNLNNGRDNQRDYYHNTKKKLTEQKKEIGANEVLDIIEGLMNSNVEEPQEKQIKEKPKKKKQRVLIEEVMKKTTK